MSREGWELGLRDDELLAGANRLVEEVGNVEPVEGQAARLRGSGDVSVDVDDVNAYDESRRQWSVGPPRRVFPELITEEQEAGE